MDTSNAKQNFRANDPLWVLLAEFSLCDFLSDHSRKDQPTAGLLFQMVREVSMPLECVEKIARLVTEFAKESPMRSKQEGLEFPARIRIFSQKKILDDANVLRTTSRPHHSEPVVEHLPMPLDFGTKMDGGWGCFLIKRGSSVSGDASLSSHYFVDLYLYREG